MLSSVREWLCSVLSIGDQNGHQSTEHKGLHDEEQEDSLWGGGRGGKENKGEENSRGERQRREAGEGEMGRDGGKKKKNSEASLIIKFFNIRQLQPHLHDPVLVG